MELCLSIYQPVFTRPGFRGLCVQWESSRLGGGGCTSLRCEAMINKRRSVQMVKRRLCMTTYSRLWYHLNAKQTATRTSTSRVFHWGSVTRNRADSLVVVF